MIMLSNSEAQVLAPGASITFNTTLLKKGCGECHRKNSGSVKITGNGLYSIEFHGNVASATADAQLILSIALNGEDLPETEMDTVSPAANTFTNVCAKTRIGCCCSRGDVITVRNSGTTAVVLNADSVLIVEPYCC